jgi:hypothetical protein
MNKTQYLAARSQWKADYFVLQQRIRDSKQALRDAHRALGHCGMPRWGNAESKEHNTKWIEAHREVGNALRARAAIRDEMDSHLIALGNLKEEARKAWEAREATMA